MMLLPRFRGRASRLLARTLATKTIRMRSERCIVSFSFDDFPRSAVVNGASALETHGVSGTFYAAGSLCGRKVDDIQEFEVDDLARLARAGHEIGCHTFGHVAVSSVTSGGLSDHIARNAEFIAEHCPGYVMSTFAYPFGDLSFLKKLLLQKRFAACRSIFPGLNAGTVDLGCLRSVALYSHRVSDAQASAVIEEAVQQRAWLIFYTHDVDAAPSRFGCTPMLLEHAITSALDAGADVMPIKNAVGAVAFRQR